MGEPNNLTDWLVQRGIKGYEYILGLGVVLFVSIYLYTGSFLDAITLGLYVWVFGVFEFICYHFNLGDLGDYYKKVKGIKNPKGNYITNLFVFSIILLMGLGGAVAGGYIVLFTLPYSIKKISVVYGVFAGLGAGLGIAVVAHIFLKVVRICRFIKQRLMRLM